MVSWTVMIWRMISQRLFAEKMGVSPVYVGKLLKGGENLTLETISKIQKAMEKNIISVTKPYAIVMSVILDPIVRFPDSAVKSVKYRGSKINQDAFLTSSHLWLDEVSSLIIS